MTREELQNLVVDIIDIKGKSEEEISELLLILESNVPHPEVSDLIYWENLTPKEIIDKAMAYKPIEL